MPKHNKKLYKYITKLHSKKGDVNKYMDELRKKVYEHDYVMDKYPIMTDRTFYVVVYRKEDLALLAVIKCGYFNHKIFGTYTVKMYGQK